MYTLLLDIGEVQMPKLGDERENMGPCFHQCFEQAFHVEDAAPHTTNTVIATPKAASLLHVPAFLHVSDPFETVNLGICITGVALSMTTNS